MTLRLLFTIKLALLLTAGGQSRAAEPSQERGSRALRAMSLARRCEVARLVARQTVEMVMTMARRDAYVHGGRAGVLVWLGEPVERAVHGMPEAEDGKLIRADESCEPVFLPYGEARGATRIDIVGQGMPRDASGPPNCLALVATQSEGTLALVMHFNRPESCVAPEPPSNGGVTMIAGRAILLKADPSLEIDVDLTGEHFEIKRAALTFPRIIGPVP